MTHPSSTQGVLLLGATGRTGSRVLTELLDRGVPVRAIVRSADRGRQASGDRGSERLLGRLHRTIRSVLRRDRS